MRRKIGVEIRVFAPSCNKTEVFISSLFGNKDFMIAGQFAEDDSVVDLIGSVLGDCSDLFNLPQEVAEALNTRVIEEF